MVINLFDTQDTGPAYTARAAPSNLLDHRESSVNGSLDFGERRALDPAGLGLDTKFKEVITSSRDSFHV